GLTNQPFQNFSGYDVNVHSAPASQMSLSYSASTFPVLPPQDIPMLAPDFPHVNAIFGEGAVQFALNNLHQEITSIHTGNVLHLLALVYRRGYHTGHQLGYTNGQGAGFTK